MLVDFIVDQAITAAVLGSLRFAWTLGGSRLRGWAREYIGAMEDERP